MLASWSGLGRNGAASNRAPIIADACNFVNTTTDVKVGS